jgi:RNA polymerase sigma-70 factor (ECF subfamily)
VGPEREEASAHLHALLLRASRFEVARRRPTLRYLRGEAWTPSASTSLEPDAEAEQSELVGELKAAIDEVLTPHQRRVLIALALNGLPIDVLAERLNTNRGATYKSLHDARRKPRTHLDEHGLWLDTLEER